MQYGLLLLLFIFSFPVSYTFRHFYRLEGRFYIMNGPSPGPDIIKKGSILRVEAVCFIQLLHRAQLQPRYFRYKLILLKMEQTPRGINTSPLE